MFRDVLSKREGDLPSNRRTLLKPRMSRTPRKPKMSKMSRMPRKPKMSKMSRMPRKPKMSRTPRTLSTLRKRGDSANLPELPVFPELMMTPGATF